MSSLNTLLARRASYISFIPFHEGGALFFPRIQRLWVLNSLASYIWLSLDEHTSTDTLIRDLSDNFSIDSARASRDLTQLLDHFKSEGLLGETAPVRYQAPELPVYFVPDGQKLTRKEHSTPASQCIIEAYGYACEIHFSNADQLNNFQQIYHYFIVEQSSAIQQTITITPSALPGNGDQVFDVYRDEQRIRQGVSDTDLYSTIHFSFFFGCSDHLSQQGNLMFHAAAVQKGEKILVFPANSGSGKSTLTAALITQGWRCITDELTVLEPGTLSLLPHPIPLRIRSGSFAPLLPYYPQLQTWPIHQDLLQHPIRWIPMSPDTLVANSARPQISTLVFVQYTDDTTTTLEPLDKAMALDKLAATGSSQREMTLNDAKNMVKLIEQTPCYTLTYSDLKNAIEKIDSV